MNKIYLSDNYIIVEQYGKIKPFPKNYSQYYEEEDRFELRKYPQNGVVEILFSDLPIWFDESGVLPFNKTTLRDFFRKNTGFNDGGAGSGSGAEIKYNVLNYNGLSVLSDVELYDFAYVRESQGTMWLPGSLGGSYYGSGLYMFDGTDWVEDDTDTFNQLDIIIQNLNSETQNRIDGDSNLLTKIDNLNHSDILNETFEQFLNYVKGLDPNPLFSYTSDLLTSITYNWGSKQTTLTLSYSATNVLENLTLSGSLANGINTNKTLNYTSGKLTSITYS